MFANIGDLTSNVISSEKNLPLLSTIFDASVFTFQVFSSNPLTLKVGKNQLIIQVTKFKHFYCLGQKVAD